MIDLAPYSKAAVGLAVALLGWGSTVVVSDPAPITAAEWVGLGFAILVGLGVYAAPRNTGG